MRKFFAASLVAFILLGGDLIFRAWAQTNTFCANNLACTVSALWNFNGGLQSNGVSVLTNPVNLATQVTGTLPGANYAAVNLAAGNVNGGVTGVLPGANMAATNLAGGNNPGGVAGTLPGSSMATFVASGASHAPGAVPDPGASAGTTHFLREDATWQTLPVSGVSEATYNSCGATTTSTPGLEFGCKIFLANSHTLTRLYLTITTVGAGCTTAPVISAFDFTGSSNLATVTASNGSSTVDSGALSVAMTAGHVFEFKVSTGGSGCSTFPIVEASATYQ